MLSEARAAVRSLVRDRGATLLSVSLLALTIGATTAVYAVVHAVVLRPLPFAEPDRTVVIWQRDPARDTPVVEVALGEVDAWRQHTRAFDALAVFGSVNWSITVLGGEARTRIPYASVSASFFHVAGTPPALGRVFNAQDDDASEPRAVIISHALWVQDFGRTPDVVGRVIRMQTDVESPVRAVEIIGVMPPTFDFPRGAKAWLPAGPSLRAIATIDGAGADWYLTHLRVFYALGRLRDGVTPVQAEGELSSVIRHTERDSPVGTPSAAVLTAVDDHLLGPAKPVLSIMLGGAILMLLLTCSSVAGLRLFRAARHDRTVAIQLALGATRHRLTRQAFLESTGVALVATVGAVGVAWIITRALVLSAQLDVPRLDSTTLDAMPVLLAMAALATSVSVLCGVWPAMFVRHVNAGQTLIAGARLALHPRERWLQRIFVGSQIAVAVVLLAGAALFVRSVQQLDRMTLGFNPDGLISIA